MAVILANSTTPSSYTAGNWPRTTMNGGPSWRFTMTMDLISSNGVYGGGNFHALYAANDNGGLYLVDRKVQLYNGSGAGTLVAESSTLTWSASQQITVRINIAAGTNASSIVISGATTGNGTTTFTTSGEYFSNSTLGVGQFTNSGLFPFSGDIGNMDDAAGIAGTASGTIAVGAATVATRSFARAAAASVAVGAVLAAAGAYERSAAWTVAVDAATNATIAEPGTHEVSAAGTIAVDAAAAARRTIERGAPGTLAIDAAVIARAAFERAAAGSVAMGAAVAATLAPAVPFEPGAVTSGLWTFGHSAATCTIPGGYLPVGGGGADADGRTPTQIDTEVSGSTFYVALARPKSTSSKTITDNKSNTYTLLIRDDYDDGSAWENEISVCVGGTGGTDHEITTGSVSNDELTIGFLEIKNCAYLADYGTAFTTNGSTQISPTGIDLKGPGWVVVDWFGDGPVTGGEGAVWTVTAQDEGSTVGTHWQVVDSRIVNHTDGWIQWKRWMRYYAAATTGIRLQLSSLSPAQGARWYAAAFMEANVTEASSAGAVAVGAAVAATMTLERTAAGSVAIAAASSATASIERAAAGEVAVSAAAVAIRSVARAAALATAIDAAVAATPARARAAPGTVAVGAETSAIAVRERTAASALVVDSSISAGAARERTAGGTIAIDAGAAAIPLRERAAAGAISIGATTSASVTGSQSADGAIAVDASTAASRSFERTATTSFAIEVVAAAVRRLDRQAAGSVVVGADVAATTAPATSPSAAGTIEIDASILATRTIERTAAGSIVISASTSAGESDPYLLVENAIFGWVSAGSGLPDGSVIWGRNSAKNGPMPSGTFISMRLLDMSSPCNGWMATEEVDGEIVHRISEPGYWTLEVTCFHADPFGSNRAQLILKRLLASVRLPSVREQLRAGNVGVGRRGPIRLVDGTRSGMLDPRAIVEIGLHVMVEVSEVGASIERALVTIETPETGEVETWVPEPPP